jgi:hypothetical protein
MATDVKGRLERNDFMLISARERWGSLCYGCELGGVGGARTHRPPGSTRRKNKKHIRPQLCTSVAAECQFVSTDAAVRRQVLACYQIENFRKGSASLHPNGVPWDSFRGSRSSIYVHTRIETYLVLKQRSCTLVASDTVVFL